MTKKSRPVLQRQRAEKIVVIDMNVFGSEQSAPGAC